MQTVPLQISDVIYNAANQTFEARVIVHDRSGTRTYACAIDAPITMAFEDAAHGLSTQALRRHQRGRSDSTRMPLIATRRTGRTAIPRQPNPVQTAQDRPHAA